MNPPMVYEVTKPSSQRTTKITAIVCSKWLLPIIGQPGPPSARRRGAHLPSVSEERLLPT
jgi:hypothetical protein